MKIIAFFFAIFTSAHTISAQAGNDNKDETYAKGLQQYFTGQYATAAETLTEAIKNNSKEYMAYMYRGNCYSRMGKLKEAEKDYLHIKKQMAGSAEFHYQLGYVYNEEGKYKKALASLDKAVTIKPKYALAYNSRGITYEHLGNIRAALENFGAAISSDSTLAIAYNNRAAAIYENQDIAAATNLDIRNAVKDLDKALKIEPGLCIAHFNRGHAYQLLKKYDLALADMDFAVKCDENNESYYLNRGKLLSEMGEYMMAINDFKDAQRLAPNDPEPAMGMADAFQKSGHQQDAVLTQMNTGIKYKSYRPLTNYNIARYYAMSGDKALMMKYLNLARKGGYFSLQSNLADFLKCPDFLPFKNDKDYEAFRNKVRGSRL